jgi:hypothetical protein
LKPETHFSSTNPTFAGSFLSENKKVKSGISAQNVFDFTSCMYRGRDEKVKCGIIRRYLELGMPAASLRSSN